MELAQLYENLLGKDEIIDIDDKDIICKRFTVLYWNRKITETALLSILQNLCTKLLIIPLQIYCLMETISWNTGGST